MNQPIYLQFDYAIFPIIAGNGLIRTLARDRVVIVPVPKNTIELFREMFSDVPQIAVVENRRAGFVNPIFAAEKLGVEFKDMHPGPSLAAWDYMKAMYALCGLPWETYKTAFRNSCRRDEASELVDMTWGELEYGKGEASGNGKS